LPYDEQLAARIREHLGGEDGLTEQKMFGGLAFLVNGNMAVAASGQGGLLVMRGRAMAGWLRVEPAEDELSEWVERGVAYARSLPPKR
jgi:hypothetical protein